MKTLFVGNGALAALLVLFASTALVAQTIPPVVPGFPNVPQKPGAVLSGLNAPQQGRTAIIAYHNGILYTVPEQPSSAPGSDFLVRTWDLANPAMPVETGILGLTPQPINAHGYLKSGDYLVLGANWPPEAPWSFERTTPGTNQRTTYPDLLCAGVRGCLTQPWFVGDTYWSYGDVAGDAFIELNGTRLSQWDHLGQTGVIGHPFVLGDLLIFASDQSRTGVATYDISDPTNPVLLDVLTTGGPGGYWPELWGGDGKLYVVFPYRTGGNGMRVVDATDPTNLQFIADTPLPGDESMYIQFQDEFAFMGGHKVDMRTFQSVLFLDGDNVVRPNDGGVGISTSQFLLPLGNLLVTGGASSNQGMAIWAHQAAPDTRGPSVGYHVPGDGRANYPVGAPISLLIHETIETFTIVNGVSFIVRPVGGMPIDGRLTYSFNDILTFTPDQPLAQNTTYEVVLPAGGIKDAAGNGMEAFSFTFSTGSDVGGNQSPIVASFDVSAYPVTPGQSATLSATGSDPDGSGVDYRFDFGDGSPRTAWSTTNSAAHAYPGEGHYRATVQVRDVDGAIATSSMTVTVRTPPSGPRATHGAPIHCDDANRLIWTVHPDNNTVAAVDMDTQAVLVEVPVCDDPRGLARTVSGEVWVACHDDDRVHVLDAAGTLVDTIDTGYGSAPAGIVATPNGQDVFVAYQGRGTLARFDAATRLSTGSADLGPRPRALAVTADGSRVLVTRFVSPKDHAEVWEVDAATLAVTRTLHIAKFGGDDNRDTTASGRGVANYLAGIAIAPDGQSAWIAANKPNSERGLFFAEDLDPDNSVRNLAVQVDLASGDVLTALDLDNSDSAVAFAYSPLGDYLFTVLQGNNEVIVFDALAIDQASGLGSLVTRLGVGAAPQGACTDPVTGRTFVQNFMDRGLTVLETDPLFRRGIKTVVSTAVATAAAEPLTPDVLRGKQVFYNAVDPRMSGEGYLSCATCHVDGGHDGRVWDFTGRGEGFRNTTTLRGRAGMAHGNVHWSANFDEIQDFENDIRGAFGGTGFMDDGDFAATSQPLGTPKAGLDPDLDALAAYVSSLGNESLPRSPFRAPDGQATAAGDAGRPVFESAGCATCHAGAAFTDSTLGAETLHNVGTLRTTSGQRLGGPLEGIDTPTLLGAWNTAPYFHDGSAPSLEDVFVVAGGAVIQAESGTPSGGAGITSNFVDLNNDDTVHGRAYVGLNNTGATLTLTGIDGGPNAGQGAIEIRYSASNVMDLDVRINGVLHAITLPNPGNNPTWRHTNWLQARVEDVTWNAGTGNTVVLTATGNFPNISIDDVVITSPVERAAAEPHRRVLALSVTDQANLLRYLRELDGSDGGGTSELPFNDGFESGDLGAWDVEVP